ncbi:MAG: hypothetical protein N4A64_00990 [Marinisporobacter sp.]|jgi:hypothetical protein|nr:hypothetical protein [Marinisporobacter sp.]
MILKSGYLLHHLQKKYYPYSIEKVNISHKWDILKLQQEIIHTLPSKDIYYPLTEEELDDIFNGQGLILGVFVENTLIGVRVVSYWDEETKNLGRLVGIKDNELNQLVFFEATIILKPYQGNKLQKLMIDLASKEIKKLNTFKYFISTVSPFNYASLKSLLNTGFYIRKLVWIYENTPRYILFKRYDQEKIFHDENFQSNKRFLIDDFSSQRLHFDKGYRGINLIKKQHASILEMIL